MHSAQIKTPTISKLIAGGFFALAIMIPAAAQHREQGPSPSAVTAVPAYGACEPTALAYKISTTLATTSSTAYATVPETFFHFTQGGTKASCVVVSFSAEAMAAANETMLVQAVVDNTTLCLPYNNYFVNSNATVTSYADRAMNYVCPSISPGAHTVQMQFRSSSGGSVNLDYKTMLVHYTKK